MGRLNSLNQTKRNNLGRNRLQHTRRAHPSVFETAKGVTNGEVTWVGVCSSTRAACGHSTRTLAHVLGTLASSPVAALSDAGNIAGFDEGSNVSRKA